MNDYTAQIQRGLSHCLTETDFPFENKYRGKVRDRYDLGDAFLLVTTDRQSAFDRVLASIPYKGQVLNLISAWWFEKTQHIVSNHVITVPDPNMMLAKKCRVFPIEFVVRGYITGTTNTSLWTQYHQGVRDYCGYVLPEGLKKNQPLPMPLITPTTKEDTHDRLISPKEIIQEQWMTCDEWEHASRIAMRLYEFGVATAKQQGLILVDTKYEMGRDAEGRIVLVDELHTPDSSRYWLADTYERRFSEGLEPENIDKEWLRLWFSEHCDPYQDEILPDAPEALVVSLSARYIQLYEMITGIPFSFPKENIPIIERMKQHLKEMSVA